MRPIETGIIVALATAIIVQNVLLSVMSPFAVYSLGCAMVASATIAIFVTTFTPAFLGYDHLAVSWKHRIFWWMVSLCALDVVGIAVIITVLSLTDVKIGLGPLS